MILEGMVVITFNFAGKSGLNSGIISTVFCISIIYSNILFYFLYGQKIRHFDIVGFIMIIVGIVLIGFGGAEGGDKTDILNSILALVSALVVGLLFALDSININYILENIKFPARQLSYDGHTIYSLVLLPFFLYEMM